MIAKRVSALLPLIGALWLGPAQAAEPATVIPVPAVDAAPADGTQTIENSANFDSSKNTYAANPVNFGPADDQVFLVLYGTGVRHRTNDASVTAAVNGVSVPALTAAQGTWPGLDQVNLALPRSLAGAGNVEIAITVEGQAANTVQVMIQ